MEEIRLDLFKLHDGNDTSFLNYFWIEHLKPIDFENFKTFIRLKKLDDGETSTYRLAKLLKRSYMTIHNWRKGNRTPKIAHWLMQYSIFGKPRENFVWLWLNSENDFSFIGRPIQVPLEIISWSDITYVLEQLPENKTNKCTKEESFAFAIGMMLGDVGKLSDQRDRLDLQLTKNVDSNKKLGEFFSLCVRNLGLEIKQIRISRNKFRWLSQSSIFFKWVYNKVLGLKDNETTTFTPVNIEWLLSSPKIIKKRVLQGIFESDGSVLYDGKITCASFPNTDMIKLLLKDFGIKSHVVNDKGWRRLGIEGITQLEKSFKVLFLSEIKTKRYKLLERLVNAEKVKPPKRIPNEIRDIIKSNKNLKSYQILKRLIDKYNFYTSRGTIEKIKREGGDVQ